MISDAGRVAMLDAMVLTMTSDGDPDESERAVVRAVYADAAGAPLDDPLLDASLARVASDPEAVWRGLAAGAGLPDPEKEAIVRSAIRVVMADGELADGELVAMQRLARAIGFRELRRVMNAVWNERPTRG